MGFELDESDWPIVVARWDGTVSDGELRVALARIDVWLTRGERFGVLIDSRAGGGFSPAQRSIIIEHMKANAERTARWLVQAAVIDSTLQRSLFYAMNLLFPNPFPSKIFRTPEAAREWLRAMLAEGRDAT
jgi:hypothetical protein